MHALGSATAGQDAKGRHGNMRIQNGAALFMIACALPPSPRATSPVAPHRCWHPSMDAWAHKRIHACAHMHHMHIHTHACAWMHTRTHECACMWAHAWMHACTHAPIRPHQPLMQSRIARRGPPRTHAEAGATPHQRHRPRQGAKGTWQSTEQAGGCSANAAGAFVPPREDERLQACQRV